MNLRKDKWEKLPLGDVCELYQPKTISGKDLIPDGKYNVWGANGIIGKYNQYNQEDEQVLISCRGEKCGVINYSEKQAWVTGNSMVAKPIEESKLDKRFLFFLLSGTDLSPVINGTAQPQITRKSIEVFKIPIPSPKEQKQIAALFQSIETAMEQVDGQEKNLKALQKTLMNGLLSKEPVFGNLLSSKNCTSTNFGEIAECDKKFPEHEKEVERFVGLEFLEAENFKLQGWGEISNGTTFSKRFVAGDILFGKRRAYLKKVAVADFDGICSGDILVIRAKADKMLQSLLPFYISADAFIQHAVSTSAGSLSPRTKWKDLAELEVSIPDIKTQSTILEVLQQLDKTVNKLKQQKTTLKNLKQKLLNEILG
jgi:type I restriction enzyme S subunit